MTDPAARMVAVVGVMLALCAGACVVGALDEPRPEPQCAPLCGGGER